MSASAERTFTIAEAAAFLRVSPRTVRRYIAEGRLPAYRLGPQLIRIKSRDLDRLFGQRIPTGGAA